MLTCMNLTPRGAELRGSLSGDWIREQRGLKGRLNSKCFQTIWPSLNLFRATHVFKRLQLWNTFLMTKINNFSDMHLLLSMIKSCRTINYFSLKWWRTMVCLTKANNITEMIWNNTITIFSHVHKSVKHSNFRSESFQWIETK